MNKTKGIVVLAQNGYGAKPPKFKEEFTDIRVDVWYDELSHLAGQHVWYKNNVYKLKTDQKKNTKFKKSNVELVINGVKLYDDINKSLPFDKKIKEGDLILKNNRINLVLYSGMVNYIEQASLLAMSLAVTNPGTPISIITDDEVPKEYVQLFDQIIPIPFNDDASEEIWKISNRWKIYHASPYDCTMVLDVDMLILQDLSTWWEFLSNYKLFFTSKVYTYRGELVTSDYYRKTFTANDLPNLYSGLHYFEKDKESLEFYNWLEVVVRNWEKFYDIYLKDNRPPNVSIDVCAAIVAKILDCESKITNKISSFPTFTHMKPRIQNWVNPTDRWQDCVGVYINRDCEIKLGNYVQTGILHYTEDDFVTPEIIERYRNYLHV